MARMLAAGGATVVGVDHSRGQLRHARDGGGPPRYVRGEASRLPLADRSFHAACCVLVLEHVAGLDDAVAELARVLRTGGRLVVFLNHPLFQTPESGWIDDRILEECYWRVGPYLVEAVTAEEVDRGVVLPFHHRPLSRYVNCILDAGLRLVRFLEPAPPPGFVALAPEYAQSADIPRLGVLVAEREA